MIKLTLPVPPSANRWHRVVNGRPILSKEAREYTKRITLLAMAQKIRKIDAPTEITVDIDWFRERRAGDVDKRGAIMLDALQGICYDNDSQIKSYGITRHDAGKKNACMHITISEAA